MMTSTLSRYFGLTFLRAVVAVFMGVFVLVTLIELLISALICEVPPTAAIAAGV